MTKKTVFSVLPETEEPYVRLGQAEWEALGDRPKTLLESIYSEGKLKIPRKFGLIVGERRAMEKEMSSQYDVQKAGAKIILDIKKKSDKTVAEIAEAMNSPLENLELFGDYMDEILSLQERQQEISYYEALVTVVLRHRVNRDWKKEDTFELTERLVERIADFMQREMEGWEGESQPSPKQLSPSNNGLPPADPQNQTGTISLVS